MQVANMTQHVAPVSASPEVVDGQSRRLRELRPLAALLAGFALMAWLDTPEDKQPPSEPTEQTLAAVAMAAVALPPPPAIPTPAPTAAPIEPAPNQQSAPAVDTALVPKAAPMPKTEARPAPAPEPVIQQAKLEASKALSEDPVNIAVDSTADDVQQVTPEGASLLAQLERGEGPNIQLAWPQTVAAHQQLFSVFRRCAGMRLGKLNAGRLVAIEPGASRVMSGYMRVAAGAALPEERRISQQLQAVGQSVRLFPRVFDQRLLSGLDRALDGKLSTMGTVRAEYRWANGRLQLVNISGDGKAYYNTIVLMQNPSCV